MEWLHWGIKSQAKSFENLKPYIKDEYYELAKKEVRFCNAKQDWKQYSEWKKHRNKSRAVLEKEYGYDTKHGAHLVRLLRMGKEILETGKVNVDRTNIDAEELKAIREGLWTYDQIEEYAHRVDNELLELYASSELKRSPDMKRIEKLCIETINSFHKNT